jgi:ATP-dependent DNA helicase RecQ
MHDIHQILQRYWGHLEFRPLQEEIIRSVLNGHDTLALLPTGGGKSVCFQVPALAKDGICIVISPLIALMKDQVQNLRSKGIAAVCIVSGMDKREIDIALDNCVYGEVRFLYVSPERLQTKLFQERVKKMKVSLIAVDEAHCISQWGYDFRPPYLQIAEIRQMLPGVPVIALTATATPEVVEDIQEKLAFKNGNVFRKSFERKNLAYHVRKEEDKYSRLLRICHRISGTGVVYVRNRKKTQEVAFFLQKQGITAGYYHAGMDASLREKAQADWIEDRLRIIVATNAFGMGIDKPEVRFVVHLDLPDSPEAYFQEAGRGGRDEKKAWAIVLYNDSDIFALEESVHQSFPDPDVIKRTYLALANYYQLAVGSGLDTTHNFELTEFCTRFNLVPSVTWNSLKILELAGYISLSESLHTPSRIKFLLNQSDLYNFQVSNRTIDPLIKLLLRSYSGLFDSFVKISERDIAKRAGKDTSVVVRFLKKLDELKVIAYLPKNDHPKITFISERVSDQNFYLSPEVFSNRKKAALIRLAAMKEYITQTHKCRSKMLLSYFGEKDTFRCGVCDHCLAENKLSVSNIDIDVFSKEIRQIVSSGTSDLKKLMEKLLHHDEKKVKTVVRWLLDNDQLEIGRDGYLVWKE